MNVCVCVCVCVYNSSLECLMWEKNELRSKRKKTGWKLRQKKCAMMLKEVKRAKRMRRWSKERGEAPKSRLIIVDPGPIIISFFLLVIHSPTDNRTHALKLTHAHTHTLTRTHEHPDKHHPWPVALSLSKGRKGLTVARCKKKNVFDTNKCRENVTVRTNTKRWLDLNF